jgi:tape measure domain-containing protein
MIDASVGLGRALLSPAADAEQTAAAFTGLLGSAQKATAFLKDLRKFAATTPFEFPELASAARKMLSFGFATRDVIPMMTRLGDAVATMGGGSDEIDRAVTAIGQMHAKTKITAEEMNQLTELGIPGWDMLAKAMGKTTAEVMDLASKGLIPADKGIEALLKGMEKFKGGMEAQSKTFKGMLSNLKDGVTLALMAFGGPILESAKVGLGELIKLVSSPAFERFATVTGRGVASVIDDINKAASKAKSGLKAFLGDLDLSPLTNGINKARSSINKFAEGINPIPVQLFLSSIKYLGVQMDRTFGIVKGTGIFLFHQLSDVIDIATGKTTKFHKSFDVVNGVMVKTRSPLQTLIGDGFFKLGSMIAIAAENVHRFGTYLQGINWMPVILGAKAFAEGAGKKASDTLTIIARIVDNKVKPAFEGIKKVIEGPVFQKFTGIMGDLATSAGGLAGSIFSLWTQLSPIGSLFKGNADVGQKFSDVLSGASSIINNYVIPAINGLSGFIRDMGPVIQPIGAKLLDMFGGFMGWLKDNGPTIMQIGGDIFKGIGDIIKDISPVIKDQFLPALDNLGKTVGPIVSDFLKWEQKTGGVKEGMSALKDVIGIVVVVASWLVNAVTFVINAFNWWKDVCYGLGFALGTLFKSIGDWFGGIGTWFRDRFNEVVTNIKNSYPGIYDAIIKPFVDAWNRISGIVANIGNAMYSVTHPGQSGGGGGDMGQFAGGVENFKGGMAIVGEKGPEMVRLPRGSDVYTASETKAMIRGMNSRMPAQSNFAQPAYKYPSAASSGGSAAPVIINNYITLEPAKVELDGREIGESAGRYVVSQVRSHGGLQ